MTEAAYATAATTVGWLLNELETAFENLPTGATVDGGFVRKICAHRVPTSDEVAVAVNGLIALGVLHQAGRTYAFDAQHFSATRDYRRGLRDGLNASSRRLELSDVVLCVAMPPDLPRAFKDGVTDVAADLRASIVNVVAAANDRLVLASPFWDVSTASDIGGLARRRVDAGVKLDILGRFGETDDAMSHLRHLFTDCRGVRFFRWYEVAPTRDSITTFHFKAVVADNGVRAYVGTANLTWSGLRSTMELGFIVGGAQGRAVARIVDSVISISEQVEAQG